MEFEVRPTSETGFLIAPLFPPPPARRTQKKNRKGLTPFSNFKVFFVLVPGGYINFVYFLVKISNFLLSVEVGGGRGWGLSLSQNSFPRPVISNS